MLIINTPTNTATFASALSTLQITNCAYPLPHPANLAITALPLRRAYIGVHLDYFTHFVPHRLALLDTVFSSEDIVSQLADADPALGVAFPVLSVEGGLFGELVESERDESRDSGIGGFS